MKTIIFFVILLSNNPLIAQDNYSKAWKELGQGKFEIAKSLWERSTKNSKHEANANLCLAMLYESNSQLEKANQYILKYINSHPNPSPQVFALWRDNYSLFPGSEKLNTQTVNYLSKIELDQSSFLSRAASYSLYLNQLNSNNFNETEKQSAKLKSISNWSFLGPFENVMNCGFDKDYGVVDSQDLNDEFDSKYGAKVKWFIPETRSLDNYVFQKDHFFTFGSLTYAQSFIKAEDQEVLVKIGYSGALKFWINNQVVYSEERNLTTELDFITIKTKLNEGYNRFLIQLGNYQESVPSFSVRLTDLEGNEVKYIESAKPKTIVKSLNSSEQLEHQALVSLKKQVIQENTILNRILLSKAYGRTNMNQESEKILLGIIQEDPDNYFALRELVVVYESMKDVTKQNYYYRKIEDKYPDCLDMINPKINEALEKEDKKEYFTQTDRSLKLYPSKFDSINYQIGRTRLDEAYEKTFELLETLYAEFPEKLSAVESKFYIENSHYKDKEKAKKVLENYLEGNYNFKLLQKLVNLYLDENNFEKAISLFNDVLEYAPADTYVPRIITNILSREKKYKEAIDLCEKILLTNPSHYKVYEDIAILYQTLGEAEKSISYYEKSLEFYPFPFDLNEKLRELKEGDKIMETIDDMDQLAIINDFNKNFIAEEKASYDIVYEATHNIFYKTSSNGSLHRYIIRMNDEEALKEWQTLSFNSSSNFHLELNDMLTIKKSGEKIDADRNGGQVVFTNLEVGDFISVEYLETQTHPGEKVKFINNNFSLNYYVPCFISEYNLYVENGFDLSLNEYLTDYEKTESNKLNGFKKISWRKVNPKVLGLENYTIGGGSISPKVHFSNIKSWNEISDWYKDVSSIQLNEDNAIRQIAIDLFGNEVLSKTDKFKRIYNFICKNIQYSSIDFRQSGYIPQKASLTYSSRLGDCKDVSSLFVSLAKAAGLEANLVLINTNLYGLQSVPLPAIEFNHCIVKAYTEQEPLYLELTDPNLPFGYLYSYHISAPILEIPVSKPIPFSKLETLNLNKGYLNKIMRNVIVKIDKEMKMAIEKKVIKTGVYASSMCNIYLNIDKQKQKDNMKSSIAQGYKSKVELVDLKIDLLEALKDTASYSYSYTVEEEVLPIASMRTFKVPFADLLFTLDIFNDSKRINDFYYASYSRANFIKEEMIIELPEDYYIIEIPTNVALEFNGNKYELKFISESDSSLKVIRTYNCNRASIKVESFNDFEDFVKDVLSAENTHLLFKEKV